MSRKSFLRGEKAANKTCSEVLKTLDYLNRLNGPERSRRERRKRTRKCFDRIGLLIEWLLMATYIETYLSEYSTLGTGPPRKISGREVKKAIRRKVKGKTFIDRLRRHEEDYADRTETVHEAQDAGALTEEAAAGMLQGITGAEGIGGTGYKVTALLRTETAAAVNLAALRAMKDAGIEYYRIRAILDSKTCKSCWKINGNVFCVAEAVAGETLPPFHTNCRCYIEAVQ